MIARTSLLTTDTVPVVRPTRGLFSLHFNNSRKRGLGKHIVQCEAEGTLYSSGHVHVDTQEVQVTDFLSMGQMVEYFEEFGECRFIWLEQ